MIAISTEELSLSFGDRSLLEGVSFCADENDKIGIIGSNGCGKSTLLKLILGEMTPDSGSIYISKNTQVGILRQDDALAALSRENDSMPIIEIMYKAFDRLLADEKQLSALLAALETGNGLDGRSHDSLVAEYTSLNDRFIRDGGLEFKGRCASTLSALGFNAEEQLRPLSTFSGGQKTRIALARELCREPDILLLDEPTNHLDIESLLWLEGFLSAYKKCVLIVSHDRYFLDKITNKTLCIENRHAKLYNGNYTQSTEQRRIDREILERHYKNQQKEIARQEAYIAQQRAWNRERNIIAAESRLKLLDKMEKIERPDAVAKGIKFGFSSSIASGNDVLTLKNAGFGYRGSDRLFSNVNLVLKRGDRLFVTGPNGCGKSTFIKMLVGRLNPSEGYVDVGYNVNIGYYDQENQNLTPTKTVLEELWDTYRTLPELQIRNTLARFGFTGENVYKSVGALSGGERARLTLSKLILSDINLLVLDEPTNHLDINSREALEEAVKSFDGTVVAVSHDRYFLGKLATRLLDLGTTDYSDIQVHKSGEAYEELLRDRARRAALGNNDTKCTCSVTDEPTQKDIYLQNKKRASDERRAQNRIKKLSAEAESIEKELEQISEEMSGGAAYDYVRLAELDTRKNELEERLLEIYEEIGV